MGALTVDEMTWMPPRVRRRKARGPRPLQRPHVAFLDKLRLNLTGIIYQLHTARDRARKFRRKGWRTVMTVNGSVVTRGQEARQLEREYKQARRRGEIPPESWDAPVRPTPLRVIRRIKQLTRRVSVPIPA